MWAWVLCTERGRARVALLGPVRRTAQSKVRLKSRKTYRFMRVRPSGYLLTYRCIDGAGNSSPPEVSRPFVVR